MIDFRTTGTGSAINIISTKVSLLKDYRPVFKLLQKDFYQLETDWFDSQGGGTWKPLDARYAQWKKAHYPGRKILQRTRLLYATVTGQKKSRDKIRPDRITIKMEKVPYWMVHHRGYKPKNIPRRQVIPVEKIRQRYKVWKNLFVDWFKGKPLPRSL